VADSAEGAIKAYGKESTVDRGVRDNFELYDESRVRLIEPRNAAVGATFAWSAEVEQSSLLPQVSWYFQGREPALISRYVLTLPAGWTVKSVTFNHPPVEPSVEGSTYTWELSGLPLIKKERHSPLADSLAPHIGITFHPGPNASGVKWMQTWSDVSEWWGALGDAQSQTGDALNGKIRELTAAATDVSTRINAIGPPMSRTSNMSRLK
jgi:Domain of Unknown Function with PDB structure (DUF3857)